MNRPLSFVLCAAALILMSRGASGRRGRQRSLPTSSHSRALSGPRKHKARAWQNRTPSWPTTIRSSTGAYPVRLDGKALNTALSEAQARSGDRAILGDMQNAKVQVYGDVAILTYNYVGVDLHKDGKTGSQRGQIHWGGIRDPGPAERVHANFAPVVPPED